jgi:hypothetical protein
MPVNFFYEMVVSMRNIRWRTTWFLILAPVLCVAGSALARRQEATQPDRLLSAADDLIPVVARLRGLAPKAPIQKGVKSREEISLFLKQEVDDHYQKSDLKNQGILLQKLGLIPSDLDYAAFTLKLLAEQVGGFYDPEKKAFFIAGWLPLEEQKPAMVHELTHAVQDQYFDLDAMFKKDRNAHNDDAEMAHQALVEGDATAVMLDYLLEPSGRTFLQLPDLVFVGHAQLEVESSQYEVLKTAPEYVKETLVFPYSYGASFLQKVRADNQPWSVVDKIYADPPASTEQIIHPQKYIGPRDAPKAVEIEDPTPQLGKDWKIAYKNVMGEFSLYLLLKLSLSEEAAKTAASGWGGDQVMLVEEGNGNRSAVFLETAWDDQESADRFYEALSGWLKHRYPQANDVGHSPNELGLVSGGEYRSVRRHGTTVRLIVGLPQSYSEKFEGK